MLKDYRKIVITGTSGFLGGRLAKFLPTAYPEARVMCTSRKDSRQRELEQAGCTFVAGDLTDAAFCQQLLTQADAVVHCAALSSPWGKVADFEKANVVATHNLLQAAISNGLRRFVFISTPSVYFDYADRLHISEKDPLPSRMVNAYAATKLKAEQEVLAANGKGMETIALRPRAIIGAEDTVIFPRVLKAYQEKKLSIVGSGNNIVDLTCVRNVIEAVVCALEAGKDAMGLAYNITNDESVKLWEQVNYILTQLGLQPVTRRLPYALVKAFAWLTEQRYRYFHPQQEPPITKYGIGILAVSMTLDNSLAKEKLGYRPVQTTREGINEFIEWYRQQ
jgi:nucleoside-diphosphate-sugar epimerase